MIAGMPWVPPRKPDLPEPADAREHKEWNSDDEDIDEFGRKKRRRKAGASQRMAAAANSGSGCITSGRHQGSDDEERRPDTEAGASCDPGRRGGGVKSALSEKQRAALERLRGRCGKRESAAGVVGGPNVGADAGMIPTQEEDLPAAQVLQATIDLNRGRAAFPDQATGSMQTGQAVIDAGWVPAVLTQPTNGLSQSATLVAPTPRAPLMATMGWTNPADWIAPAASVTAPATWDQAPTTLNQVTLQGGTSPWGPLMATWLAASASTLPRNESQEPMLNDATGTGEVSNIPAAFRSAAVSWTRATAVGSTIPAELQCTRSRSRSPPVAH